MWADRPDRRGIRPDIVPRVSDAPIDEDEVHAELARLRELVGPSEIDYRTLRDDVRAATEMARAAESEAGRLRAHVEQLSTDLWRARQDQDLIVRRREMTLPAYLRYRVARRWRISAAPRLRRLWERVSPGAAT